MKLTEHFSLEELIISETATRKGIDNTPSPHVIGNLLITAQGLEKVRELLKKPITVSSGYRSPALNRVIGGSDKSAHTLGYAADFNCYGYGSAYEVCKAIERSGIKFDQLIYEQTWSHISFAPTMRQEVLTAIFKNGKATYKAGL